MGAGKAAGARAGSRKSSADAPGTDEGAHRLNEASIDALERIGSPAASWRIRHQTGTADLAEVSAAYRRLGLPARVEAFVDDMGGAYREADVVVARSGAMSCAEITAMGLPSLLVPYPWAADDHHSLPRAATSKERAGRAEIRDL